MYRNHASTIESVIRGARRATAKAAIAVVFLGGILIASSATSAGSAMAGHAADGLAAPTLRITVRKSDVDNPATAQRLIDRIDEAAMEVCGASPFSFPDVRRAVRRSDCWRQSVATAVAQARDLGLSARLEQRPDGDAPAIAQ